VIKFFEVYHDNQFIHLVMEYLEGGDLESFFNVNKDDLNEKQIAKIFY
jgi:serine/threonine protein kinase